ncbi:MAG: TetR family transcriptional regulator C-terminal domain-containing protein [Phycicoccus sp.]|nr:TetR family transcriptional regulator C-terminal domain-containing protein [Phycicoccus sp.]
MDLTPRQSELADAGLRIVAREGMSAVTFRSVAAESGWSLGAVQKAYPTKDALVHAMFARLRAGAAAGPAVEPGRPTLRAWLVELLLATLPIDEARRATQLHGAAFAERAAYDSVIGEAIALSDSGIRVLLTALVSRAVAEGEVAAGVDAELVAWAFLALAQGIATQLLYDPMDEARVRERAAWAIERLLTPVTG